VERIRAPVAPSNGAYDHADAADEGARCDRRGGFAAAAGHLRGSPCQRRAGVARAGSDTVTATVANKISYSLATFGESHRSAGFDHSPSFS